MSKSKFSQKKFKISKSIVLLFLLSTFILVACNKDKKVEQAAKKPIPVTDSKTTVYIQLAHEPFLTEYLKEAIFRFDSKDFRLTGNRKIYFELIPVSGNAAYDEIASGKLKVDAWISSPYYLQLADKERRNLGPEQSDCRTLFYSPVVLTLPSKLESKIRNFPGELSLQNIIKELSTNTNVSLAHRNSSSSFGGVESILQLASAALPEGVADLESLDLDIENSEFQKEFTELLKKVSYYGDDTKKVLSKSALNSPKRVSIGIASEYDAVQYNKSTSDPDKRVSLIYPNEGSHFVTSTMCNSNVEWVTRDKKTALSIFSQFLHSTQEKKIAKAHGFRTPRNSPLRDIDNIQNMGDDAGSLDKGFKKYGASPTKPEKLLNYPSYQKTKSLIKLYETNAKPQKVSILLDISGSMQGESLAFAQAFVHNIAINLREDSVAELVTFSGEPETLVPFTTDKDKITDTVRAVKAAGGSATIDALKLTLEKLVQESKEDYVRSIILITDGPDISSKTPLIVVSNMLSNVLSGKDFSLFIVDIINKDADSTSFLKELTKAGKASFYSAEPKETLDILPKIIRDM